VRKFSQKKPLERNEIGPSLKPCSTTYAKELPCSFWKLDRLARSLKQLIETIEALKQRKTGFKSLTESIHTTTDGGKLIRHVFGGLAECVTRRSP
jgi:DNA invertase Pin-like site-specific DNA recombinase